MAPAHEPNPSQYWVQIGDSEYDVSGMWKKHPGGSVISSYFGQDATDAFSQFHMNMPKADKWLKTLPKRPVEKKKTGKVDVEAEFREWTEDLTRRGFFKPSYPYVVYKIAEPLVMYAIGCYLMATFPSAWSIAVACILFSQANVKCGWIQHEGGHTSLTTIPKVDKFIQAFSIGLGLSTCGFQWNRMHNRHHATPQKINHDVDLDTLPLVGFFKGCVEKTRKSLGLPVSKLWLRLQAWTFMPVVCGGLLWLYWVYNLHLRTAIKKDWASLFFMLASHVVKPMLFVHFGGATFLQGYALFMVCYWLTGMCLFGHFSLSHTFMPVVEDGDHKNWVAFAMDHTVDISPGNHAVDWMMGFLNYQVIHHLFPTMPQFRGPAVSRELRDKAKRWGIKYNTMDYWPAWGAMLGNLDEVGKHYWADAAKGVAKVKVT
mmetsp:Transcript_22828/g.58115  ORF Transcript_22828/g.58115 Transcript_22828/m.58115 type:complete len:429 (-) Transcript_22828:551-1837(-)|eukprot:CAMPEP_0202866706 /NCGR_PEP_ID=MMETSP1391-20130828/8313_1 /ASSEMBLY_ACC=CAM_ASM_000867 /TAXON_ID=1034604 /ORGANISM="Chlamydomonas leiostraca, Strain SAG 11-49" /LENGTH=428 /DNA_ID=CAMNT_0049546683 /DNA_START=36 /DNA_END=1322 /DNA_ORIENTATION=-